jgi:hypothetical protein
MVRPAAGRLRFEITRGAGVALGWAERPPGAYHTALWPARGRRRGTRRVSQELVSALAVLVLGAEPVSGFHRWATCTVFRL